MVGLENINENILCRYFKSDNPLRWTRRSYSAWNRPFILVLQRFFRKSLVLPMLSLRVLWWNRLPGVHCVWHLCRSLGTGVVASSHWRVIYSDIGYPRYGLIKLVFESN